MSKDLVKEFGEGVVGALSIFQVIESSLKLYITYSFRLIQVRLGPNVAFNFNGDDYENSSLETLIKIFSKLSNNKELIEVLKQRKKDRNYVAHQAYIQYLKIEGEESHTEHSEKIHEISVEAVKCLALVQAELVMLDKMIKAL